MLIGLDSGANPNLKNKRQHTALDLAKKSQDWQMVALLKKSGGRENINETRSDDESLYEDESDDDLFS